MSRRAPRAYPPGHPAADHHQRQPLSVRAPTAGRNSGKLTLRPPHQDGGGTRHTVGRPRRRGDAKLRRAPAAVGPSPSWRVNLAPRGGRPPPQPRQIYSERWAAAYNTSRARFCVSAAALTLAKVNPGLRNGLSHKSSRGEMRNPPEISVSGQLVPTWFVCGAPFREGFADGCGTPGTRSGCRSGSRQPLVRESFHFLDNLNPRSLAGRAFATAALPRESISSPSRRLTHADCVPCSRRRRVTERRRHLRAKEASPSAATGRCGGRRPSRQKPDDA